MIHLSPNISLVSVHARARRRPAHGVGLDWSDPLRSSRVSGNGAAAVT
jgi:hypothetical protein